MGVVEEQTESFEVSTDDFQNYTIEEEKESAGESLNLNESKASFSTMAYPSDNWGFSYQVDKSRMDATEFWPWRGDFLNLFLPTYNNFVDHAARRINELQADANLALSENDYQSTQISTISKRSSTNQSNITALSGSLSYVTGLIDHLGNTVVPNVATIAKNAQSVADYAKSSVDHIGGTVIPSIVSTNDYQAEQISTISNRSNSNKTGLATTKGVADYAKSSVDHLGGTVVPNLVAKDDYQADQISTLSARSTANLALIAHLSGTVIPNLVDDNEYQNSQIISNTVRSTQNKTGLATVKGVADYAKATVDHIGGTVIPSIVESNEYQSTQISTVSQRSNVNAELLDHLGGTVVPNLVAKDTYQASQITTVSARSMTNEEDNTSQQTQINTLMASELMSLGTIAEFKAENAENLTYLLTAVKSLKNYDDTSFKTFIGARFKDFFYVGTGSYESGIVADDGVFSRLIKGQFTRIMAEMNRQLTLSLTATTNNIDGFETYLREEFALLNDWYSLQVDWSKMINDNILIAIAALDKLFLKPDGTVNLSVPPFDFDRLQEILDSLDFGNVVNEAGTNFWDVLQQLIDSLGGLAESIMAIVPDLIEELVALVIPEDKEFFSKKLTALTDSFDTKFSGVLKLSDSVKNIYSQPKSMNSITYTIFDVEMKLIPDFMLSKIGDFRTVMGALIYLGTFISIYKRFVGQGDVIQ